MALLENELARREKEAIALRPSPLRIRWELADLAASDGHVLSAAFACSVRAIPDRTERRMLEEVMLEGKTSITAADVSAHFLPALRSAAAKAAARHSAQKWLEEESPKLELIEALKSAAASVAFSCGVETLPPFQADVRSSTFERQRLREMHHALSEKQAAGQVEHFQRTADLFQRFEALRAAAPGLSPGRILQQVGAADQGAVLQALLMASAGSRPMTRLWAVAGPSLVAVDARTDEEGRMMPVAAVIPLPQALGPLRSVHAAEVEGQRVLLVGARAGFLIVDPQRPEDPKLYHDNAVQTEHGFNRIIYAAGRRQFCGTHADAGLVCWDADSPRQPVSTLRTADLPPANGAAAPLAPSPAAYSAVSYAGSMQGGGFFGPRNVIQLDDSSLLFSLGSALHAWDGRTVQSLPLDSRADVIDLLPDGRQLLCILGDGTVAVLDRATRQWVSREQRAPRVRAAGTIPWLGSQRILLAPDEGPVQCVGLEDPLVTQYASPHRGMRMVAGAAERVAAVSPDRQRIILWNSWEGRQPAAEVFVTPLTRHRITGLAFG